jgi:stage V sporulation protein R
LSHKNKSPVEPTEDILRVIIDNSKKLDDWEIDICETLREEGIFYHPNAITHLMNEGFATISHEKIMRRLFELQLLTQEEHGQFNDANARVKAMSLYQVNPYAVGSAIYYDIENRWNKGRFGDDWDQCENIVEKETWDDKLNLGWQKCLDITRTHNDYFFVMEFLTEKLIEDMFLFIYQYVETHDKEKFIRTKHGLTEIKKLIISFYSHSTIPLIKVINTNPFTLVHSHFGLDLDLQYAVETLKHIYRLCGVPVYLQTVVDTAKVEIEVDGNKEPKIREL